MRTIERFAVLVFACVFVQLAGAAETVNCTVIGTIQGPIQGDPDVTTQGRANTIQAYDYHHLVTAPYTGQNQHENIILSKKLDKATVKLWRALDTRESLSWDCRFYRPNPNGDGTTEQYYTITLANARIVSMEPLIPNALDPATSAIPAMERLRLSYQTMTVTWTNGGISYQLTPPGTPQ